MNAEIVESFAQMVRDKGIDKDLLAGTLEEIFGMLVKKKYGEEANFNVIVNVDRGDIEIYLLREVVEVVENPANQISLEEVNIRGNVDGLDIGEEFVESLSLASFGRRLILLAKQSLNQRVRDIDRDIKLTEYRKLLGEIIVADIHQIRKNDIVVMQNKTELLLPRSEMIPTERYKKGDSIRAIVKEIRPSKSGFDIIISRSDNQYLKKLFELEVPEVFDGIITIRTIARRPGEKAKIVVESGDKRIDPVGACVGMKGVRIHSIVHELGNENIDVLQYTPDIKMMIQKSLSPGKITKIEIDEESKTAYVYAKADSAAQILGRGGVNTALTTAITGYKIEIIREAVVDRSREIELKALEQDSHLMNRETRVALENAGFDTAKDVLNAGVAGIAALDSFTQADAQEIYSKIEEFFANKE